MRSAGIRLAVIASACAVVLGGCGGGGDQSASDAVQSYVDAQNHQNFAQVCELLSAQLRAQIGGRNCARFINENTSGTVRHPLSVISVKEDVDHATAELRQTGESGKPVRVTISLQRQDGDWRVTSLGGAPPAP